jgi:signal transduction histidine kinase
VLSAPRVTDWVAGERFDALWLVEALLAAAAWTLVALRLAARARRSRAELPPYLPWRVAALSLMAASELLYSVGLAGALVASTIAAGFVFVAAAIMLTIAAVGLREAFAATSLRTLQLADELRDTRVRLQLVEERQRERLHDARTALVGVVGATRVYARPGEESQQSTDLQRIVAAEMQRLSSLLDLDAEEPVREFALAGAFEPVLLAHRALGMRLHADLDGLHVRGRPTVTATVLANLLTNAAAHAPGATVVVRAASAGATVRISVEDDGPGIPVEERELVLHRGVRSSTARTPGSGLGLYSAAQAMAGQGGSLRVESRHDGAPGTRVVLGIPAAVGVRPLAPLRAKAS